MRNGNPPNPPEPAGDDSPYDAAFEPVPTRHRHDGWTPDKQTGFIEALGECGCVDEACKRVGMSTTAAYALRRRVDAQSFRVAWDAALDYAIRRLSDAAFARALHGVTRPVFYQGEQIGERRYYDERLTMFLLRYRNPERYGAWLDGMEAQRHPDGAALTLAQAVDRVAEDGWADAHGHAVPERDPLRTDPRRLTERDLQQAETDRMRREKEQHKAEWRNFLDGKGA